VDLGCERKEEKEGLAGSRRLPPLDGFLSEDAKRGEIFSRLKEPSCAAHGLRYRSPFELLVAVILSARPRRGV